MLVGSTVQYQHPVTLAFCRLLQSLEPKCEYKASLKHAQADNCLSSVFIQKYKFYIYNLQKTLVFEDVIGKKPILPKCL